MQLNSLLTNTGSQSNVLDLPNQIKNNKPTYLFSDIIRMITTNQSEPNNSDLNTVSYNTPSSNFNDISAELQKTSNSTTNSTAALNDLFSNDNETQNTVSAANLKNFLNDLFNQLTALGYSLKNIKGIPSQNNNSDNVNLSADQDQSGINFLQGVSKNEIPFLLNLSSSKSGDESKNGININDKKINQDGKTDSQSNANLNQLVINILKSNRPVVFNFTFANQPIQIEISKSGDGTAAVSSSNIENTQPEKFISNLLDQISKGSIKYQTAASNSNNENQVIFTPSLSEDEINSGKLNNTENLSSEINKTANNQLETNKDAVQGGVEKQIVSTNSSKDNTLNTLDNNQFKITASSGSKNSSLNGIQDLEQFLSQLNSSDDADSKLVNPQIKLFYDLNNWKIKNVSPNINNSTVDSASLIKNNNTQSNLSSIGDSFTNYVPDLFQGNTNQADNSSSNNSASGLNNKDVIPNFNFRNYQDIQTLKNANGQRILSGKQLIQSELKNNSNAEKNSYQNEGKKSFVDSKTNSIKSASQKESAGKILQENENLKISTDKELTTNSVNLNKKDLIADNKIANQTQPDETSNLQTNSVNKLAGAVQTSKQASNEGSENKPANDGKITSNISAADKSNQIISANTDTSNGDNGKKSDTNEKQDDNALITSAQALNSDKQSVSKNNFDLNVKQFNDVYKTVQASDLISEISHFIGQGQSKSIELKLKPEDLGKVKISLEVVDKVVHANIEVENESVKQMVQTNVNNLKQSLSQNGLQLSNISVSISGGEAKSNKSFVQKKKTNPAFISKKFDTENNIIATKSMGYNTYEYLI